MRRHLALYEAKVLDSQSVKAPLSYCPKLVEKQELK